MPNHSSVHKTLSVHSRQSYFFLMRTKVSQNKTSIQQQQHHHHETTTIPHLSSSPRCIIHSPFSCRLRKWTRARKLRCWVLESRRSYWIQWRSTLRSRPTRLLQSCKLERSPRMWSRACLSFARSRTMWCLPTWYICFAITRFLYFVPKRFLSRSCWRFSVLWMQSIDLQWAWFFYSKHWRVLSTTKRITVCCSFYFAHTCTIACSIHSTKSTTKCTTILGSFQSAFILSVNASVGIALILSFAGTNISCRRDYIIGAGWERKSLRWRWIRLSWKMWSMSQYRRVDCFPCGRSRYCSPFGWLLSLASSSRNAQCLPPLWIYSKLALDWDNSCTVASRNEVVISSLWNLCSRPQRTIATRMPWRCTSAKQGVYSHVCRLMCWSSPKH